MCILQPPFVSIKYTCICIHIANTFNPPTLSYLQPTLFTNSPAKKPNNPHTHHAHVDTDSLAESLVILRCRDRHHDISLAVDRVRHSDL